MDHKIKLFIHESFFDAFSKLPRQIQKKTRDFMKKFRENPTSSALNYEKISSFLDQTLRTVRIDLKYRAIVKAPEKGNGYHLLWVDNHDEAMDWARNKVFEWNDNTKTFQLYDRPAQVKVIEEPEKQSLASNFTDDQLLKMGTPKLILDQVKKINSISDLEKLKEIIPKDNFEYLYYLLEGVSYEEIMDDINQGLSIEEDELSSNAKRSVFVLSEDTQIEEYLTGDFQKWKIYLHPSQRSIAFGEFKGPIKVLGGAGTGKTVCALHRLKYLSDSLGIYDKPILLTTYTKSLAKYLGTVVREMTLNEETYEIANFDKLIFRLARGLNVISKESGYILDQQESSIWLETLAIVPSSKDQFFLKEEYNEVILNNQITSIDEYLKTPRIGRSVRIGRKDKVEIWALYQEYLQRKGPNYTKNELCNLLFHKLKGEEDKIFSSLICDELQDFNSIELRLMRVLVPEKENDMFFVGDPYQNIYNRKINFSQAGINIKGRRSKRLRVNYRTTEEIKKYAVKTVMNVHKDDFDGDTYESKGYVSLIHGDNPTYNIFDNSRDEQEFVVNTLQALRRNFGDGEICIAARTNYQIDKIKHHLHNVQIDFEDLGKEEFSQNTIKLSTFHNLKGHEFKALILVSVSSSTIPYTQFPQYQYFDEAQKTDHENNERSLLYVAISRAIHSLYITGTGEPCNFIS